MVTYGSLISFIDGTAWIFGARLTSTCLVLVYSLPGTICAVAPEWSDFQVTGWALAVVCCWLSTSCVRSARACWSFSSSMWPMRLPT
ncbi:hypothetical protein D3C78_1429380 [compost metagenome]